MLVDMLKQNPTFSSLPTERQEVIARLASEFEENDFALYLDPMELSAKLGIGNRHQWQEFLNYEPVRQYINAQMAHNAQVAQRKTFQGLLSKGMGGDVQAIKEINELSGVMNSGERNKVVVLHRIDRPTVVRKGGE